MEQYSLVQQYQSPYLVNGSSNEKYTRLIHNVHASIQLYDCTKHSHSHTSIFSPYNRCYIIFYCLVTDCSTVQGTNCELI